MSTKNTEQTEPHVDPVEVPTAIDQLSDHLRELGAETSTERTVKRIVPWVMSLALHGGLIVLGFLIVVGVTMIDEEEEPLIVRADFNNLNYEPLTEMAEMADEQQQTVQDRIRTNNLAETLDDQLRELDVDPITLISDAASATDVAEFAPQPRQGTARFAGLTGTNARRIAFVVDASGSMITSFGIILEELSRSIDGLVAEQDFQIIFFQNNEAVGIPPLNQMLEATAGEKLRALKWIDENVVPQGRSNPLNAIRAAIRLEPDIIFMLSNDITGSGQFEIDQDDLLEMLREMNPIDPETGRRKVQIQTIQFLDRDPLDTLRKIALEHSGEEGYKFLDRQELGIGRN